MAKKQELASVKKGPTQEVVSKEEYERRVQEIKRCREDICYFAEHYFRIITLDNGLQLIKLYPKQKELLRAMVDNKRICVLACRQSGKSTSYNIFTLWYCMFHSAKSIMMCAQREATAVELLNRIRLAYEYIPEWIKPSVTEYNKKSIEFGNMSTIKAFATKGGGARGQSCVVGSTKVTIVDDFEGIWYTRIDKVKRIANSSETIVNNISEEFAMKKYNFVYKTVNKLNGREYIGVHTTDDLDDGYLGSGKILGQAIEKYGPENFERTILKFFDNRDDAFKYEAELVTEEYVKREDTYNITTGGNHNPIMFGKDNPFFGKKHDEKTMEKIKASHAKYFMEHGSPLKNYNFREDDDVIVDGKRYKSISDMKAALKINGFEKCAKLLLKDGNGFVDPERQKKLKEDLEVYLKEKEIRHQHHIKAIQVAARDPERCKKISESKIGKPVPWINKINKNPEKIRKTAEKHRGMKRSEQAKANMSEAKKQYFANGGTVYNKGKIFIVNLETGEKKMIMKDETIPEGWKRGMKL